MMSMAINSRWYRYLPWALLLAYAALALILHEERIMNTDCSLQFFSSVNKHGFFFQESRYGVLPTQVPLVLGILLGLPMKWLVIIYSMTFPLVYGAILLIEQRVLRSTEAALATIASLIIGQASTFLHCTTETHLLLAASGMLYATWQALGHSSGDPLRRSAPFLVVLWCMTIHPNALFTVGFVCALAWINKLMPLRSCLVAIGTALTYTAAAMLLADKGTYDANQYESLRWAFSRFDQIASFNSVWFLKEWAKGQYIVPLIMAAAV
jgi:hypothetical protein